MGFQCGIVGLPNVGKSTLFNVLTQANIDAANYPFCTIEPNVGIVPVPDPRLQKLAAIVKPQNIIPTAMKFVDIAGLVAGAAQGEGLGNKFLAHIRETQAICHVVRCFEDADVTHVTGNVNPASDIETINTELILADLEMVEKAIDKVARTAKGGDKTAKATHAVLLKMRDHLGEGHRAYTLDLDDTEKEALEDVHLITLKPVLYVANVDENGLENNPLFDAVKIIADKEKAPVIALCAQLEAEISQLDDNEKNEFLADLGLKEPGLNRLIRAGHNLLGLQSFFTAGVKEVRGWTVPIGATAQEAAGVIHTDFIKHFIRAEIADYEDYVTHGGEQGTKEAGKWRVEGKEYIVQDGDVIYFRVSC